jgi:hypothetical protein
MPFLKEDLAYQHYNWKQQNTSSIFKGPPSRRLFDRFDGEQVLFIINFYGALSDKFSITEGRAMEEMLSNHLPIEAKSELSVFNWLRSVC